MSLDDLMTPAQLSEEIEIPERTLERWRYTGNGPSYVRLGRHIRYTRAAVEQWVEEQTVDFAGR